MEMKKILLTFAFVVAAVTLANAQLYVGGSVGLNSSGGNTVTTDGVKTKTPSASSLTIAPRLGYFLNDKSSIGGILSYTGAWNRNKPASTWSKTHTLALTPFYRYEFLSFKKFGVSGEARIPLSYATRKDSSTPDGQKNWTFGWGLTVTPVLTYDLSKRISFETALNFFSFSYRGNRSVVKTSGGDKASSTGNSFGIGANDNLFQIGNIEVGFIYKF